MSSSLDSIYKKMISSLEPGSASSIHEAKFDPARHISPVLAHELNNIFTIIQGYADRLLMKQGDNAALAAQLKLISDAARRATALVQSATEAAKNPPPRPQPNNADAPPPAA